MAGPAWVGIGAQRSGTTWFTDLLLQHPATTLSAVGEKELHFFDRFLLDRLGPSEIRKYRRLFNTPYAGEFTPAYLRSLWVPALAVRCWDNPVVIVMLRDPIERFHSAMRWYLRIHSAKRRRTPSAGWLIDKGTDATWGGMYATQLAVWTTVLPAERFVVIQYEAARANPQASADRVWSALGLDPVKVTGVPPSWTSTDQNTFQADEAFRGRLQSVYRPEVERLGQVWAVDRSLWPNFSGQFE